jgi:hypothetical protein
MEGLKSDQNLEFLINKKLTQVCVSEGQIILRFDDVTSISIESDCSVETSGSEFRIINYKLESHRLLQLLGANILQSGILPDGGMFLVFNDRTRLSIFNSNDIYESFQIHTLNAVIVA